MKKIMFTIASLALAANSFAAPRRAAQPVRRSSPSTSSSSASSSSSSSSSSGGGFSNFLQRPSFQSFDHEVGGGMYMLGVAGGAAGSTVEFGKGGSVFSISGSYYKTMNPFLQVGGSTSMAVLGGNASYVFLAGARLNFGPNMEEAFFVTPSIGLIKVGASGFIMDLTVGKRIKIFPSLSYTPGAGFSFTHAGGSRFRFHIDPIKFTYSF
jgi:hypothetical protein